MKEVWKDIKGYEGLYQVSNKGNVKSLNYHKEGYEKTLKPKKHNKGYLQIQLMGKENRTFTIHRLVAEAFLPNPNNYPCINHKDENKQNNSLDNLEWCDNSYNAKYSIKLHPERIKNRKYTSKKSKLNYKVNQFDNEGNLIKTWNNSRTIFLETGMSDWAISECCKGNRKSAYGFNWQYAN